MTLITIPYGEGDTGLRSMLSGHIMDTSTDMLHAYMSKHNDEIFPSVFSRRVSEQNNVIFYPEDGGSRSTETLITTYESARSHNP
jgi:hypothetical protein